MKNIQNVNEEYKIIFIQDSIYNDYKIKMFLNADIKGIIKKTIVFEDNKAIITYNYAGYKNIQQYIEVNKVNYNFLEKIHLEFIKTREKVKSYLLNENDIILDVNYIFYSEDLDEVKFCYFPENKDGLKDCVKTFYKNLIKYLDYDDLKAVKQVYELERLAMNDEYSISYIEQIFKQSIIKDENNINLYNNEGLRQISNSHKEEHDKSILSEYNNGLLDNVNLYDNGNINKKITFLQKIKNFIEERKKIKMNKKYKNKELETIESEKYNNIKDISLDYGETTLLNNNFNNESNLEKEALFLFKNIETNVIYSGNKLPSIIGKTNSKADICIDDTTVSRAHLRIFYKELDFFIQDLNSTNGTVINDYKLNKEELYLIKEGDILKIGTTYLKFIIGNNLTDCKTMY